jgi:hypothetical protein
MKEPTSGKQLSFWIDTTPRTNFPTLQDDTAVDVAILGGGIVGLTAAVLLKRLGKTVAVIEARRVAEGVTGNTTAKVTSQHRLIYDTLIKEHGERKARLYGEANEAAIDRIAAFVGEKKSSAISCACRPTCTRSPMCSCHGSRQRRVPRADWDSPRASSGRSRCRFR